MRRLTTICALVATPLAAQTEPPRIEATTEKVWEITEANQGVGVDEAHFYAVDNRTIAKFDKLTGELVDRWDGAEDGGIGHLDSAALVDGRLYAANSNYPDWPMTSSVEVFDAATLEHVDSVSLGINYGSFTWLDRHDGSWWGTFANYNRVFGESPIAYGNKHNTMLVRFDDAFRFMEGWVYPEVLIESFGDMSNSGGSWGPDGRLYITGHDAAEAYAIELPQAGSTLDWVGTIGLENTGQGFAWDRSAAEPTIYAIIRGDSDPENRVTVNVVPMQDAAWTQ